MSKVRVAGLCEFEGCIRPRDMPSAFCEKHLHEWKRETPSKSSKTTSESMIDSALDQMAKGAPVALGIILLIVGWFIVFSPFGSDSLGDAHSADYFHDLCEDNAWISFLAPEECDQWNSLWSFGWGVIIVGGIVFIIGLISYYSVSVQTVTPQPTRKNSSNKYCSSCGVELPLAAKFCTECGVKIE